MHTPRTRNTSNFVLWYLLFFLPRKITGSFIRRAPKVYAFGEGSLGDQLRNINVFAPTRICRVMTRHGSDKGRLWHNYTTVYSALLRGWHASPVRIFELGLGTDNPNLVSS